jgi:hypothetical protein
LETQIAELAGQIEASRLGDAMRGGVQGLYGWVNVAHLLGLVLLVGGIGVLDLRILGFGRTIPPAALSRMLTPLAIVGLLVSATSGALLFAADAGPLSRSLVFRLKLALIALGLINAALFRLRYGDLSRREPSARAKVMAAGSIGAWLGVGALGRMIAYT